MISTENLRIRRAVAEVGFWAAYPTRQQEMQLYVWHSVKYRVHRYRVQM